jgi:hypothetical protein
MPRVAISGHRGLPDATTRLIAEAIGVALQDYGGAMTGLSCLADGAYQIFARAVLDSGGEIEAVIPAKEYREGLPAGALAEYDALLAKAETVHALPFTESTSESHMAASEFMIDHAEVLVGRLGRQASARVRRHGRCGGIRAQQWPPSSGDLARRIPARLKRLGG